MRLSALLLLLACSGVEESTPELAQPEAPNTRMPAVPIQGGTMERVGDLVLLADPGAGVVEIVSATSARRVEQLDFGLESQPSRMAVDGTTAFVVLRGAGSVAAIDALGAQVAWSEWVCAEPRGVDVSAGEVVVACAGGELVTIDATDGSLIDSVYVDTDLRDVVVDGDIRYVSRFRSAEVLEVDRSGAVLTRQAPPIHDLQVYEYNRSEPFLPHVAWRMIAHPDGGVVMLHQRSTDMELEERPGTKTTDLRELETTMVIVEKSDDNLVQAYYGPPPPPVIERVEVEIENPYVGPDCRSSVTHSAVTWFRGDGQIQSSVPVLTGGLAVDISFDGAQYAIVSAGSNGGSRQQLAVIDQQSLFHSPWACIPDGFLVNDGSTTSVMLDDGQLVVGSRYPRRIDIGDQKVVLDTLEADPGFSLFHEDTGIGMACASCHPEGQDDGHTWRSTEDGTRRTMRASGGLKQTAPYHWAGDHGSLVHLLAETRVERMDGRPVSSGDAAALLDFLHDVPTPKATPRQPELVETGRQLFDERGCATCHLGDQLTNNKNEDIGRAEVAQTPSLIGVGLRQPLMRDGCASNLEERFTNEHCGGEKHGEVDPTETEVISALVAYLESL